MSPLATDLSALPAAQASAEGEPPDEHPRFVHLLVEQLARDNEQAGAKPTAYATRIRHSDAGKCARAIAYSAAGIPRSDPMDLAGTWVTSLGTLIHEAWQAALQAVYPDSTVEPKLKVPGLDASGHADAVVNLEDGRRLLYELKTCGGFGYKLKVGERGLAQGPSYEHKAQAALNALAVDADEMVIGYMATEAISKAIAERKHLSEWTHFCAEWTYTREQFEPWALAERGRMLGILDLLDQGVLAARKVPSPEVPSGAEIVDPSTSRWQVTSADGTILDTGALWGGQFCSYCSYQSLCVTTKPGRIPVSDVRGDAA